MKDIKITNIVSEDGKSLNDIIINMNDDYSWMDVFEKVQAHYLDNVDSYSYTEI